MQHNPFQMMKNTVYSPQSIPEKPHCLFLLFNILFVATVAFTTFNTTAQTTNSSQARSKNQRSPIYIDHTLEAASGYLRIHTQLHQGNKRLTGKKQQTILDKHGLGDLLSVYEQATNGTLGNNRSDESNASNLDTSFMAFLDTGASATVLSVDTAKRFNLKPETNAVYHEFGLHGESPMSVSKPCQLALTGSSGTIQDTPKRFTTLRQAMRFQINSSQTDPMSQMVFGNIDVIGMPAIRQLIVEIDPTPMAQTAKMTSQLGQNLNDLNNLEDLNGLLNNLENVGIGPAIRLHDPRQKLKRPDLIVPLIATDFSRHQNPNDRGPKPTVAQNPVIPNVEIKLGQQTTTVDLLLDTGAPVSMISTQAAQSIGLFDANGNPTQPVQFQIPLSGIGGQKTMVSGYVLDSLEIKTLSGQLIIFRQAYVLVHDIGYQLDDGEPRILDGIFGLNFLLPSASGISSGIPTQMNTGPFQKIWINGPRYAIGLDLHDDS